MIAYLKNSHNKIFVVIIILTSLFIYSPTIKIPFITDEIAFIQRNEIQTIKDAPTLLEKKDYDEGYYRPLPDLISGLITLVFRYNNYCYRIFNASLHTVAGVLIYFFILSLPFYSDRKELIALFSALFFITFPLNDYSVIWHTDLFDRFMLLFYISGLLVYVNNNLKPSIYSVTLFTLSLLSKEMAFSFPIIIGLIYFCFSKDKSKIKGVLFALLPYLIVAVLFILFRILIFGNNIFSNESPHSTGTLTDIIKNYFLFGGLLICPFYVREIQGYILAHQNIAIILGIFLILPILFYIRKIIRKDIVLTFFILFILITIAPASRLLMRWYLYLPSIGFTSAAAYFIFTLKFKRIGIPVAIAISLLLLYSGALIIKEFKWVETSNKAITALNNFIKDYKPDLVQNEKVIFATIPAKVDDIPVFQLGFDKLFNFYLNNKRKVEVEVLTKSFIFNFYDSITTNIEKDRIGMQQINDNYFILFNNEENVKFYNMLYKKGSLNALTIIYQGVKNKILYTFSNGKFYKIQGSE